MLLEDSLPYFQKISLVLAYSKNFSFNTSTTGMHNINSKYPEGKILQKIKYIKQFRTKSN